MCNLAQCYKNASFRVVHTNADVLSRLATPNAFSTWMFAIHKLTIKPGQQVVDFAGAPRRLQKELPHLVETGILRPHPKAVMKFYLPRKIAHASLQ